MTRRGEGMEAKDGKLRAALRALLEAAEAASDGIITVKIRWWDGYFEQFKAIETRAGSDLLWVRLVNGETRSIPLRQVRWFSGVN